MVKREEQTSGKRKPMSGMMKDVRKKRGKKTYVQSYPS